MGIFNTVEVPSPSGCVKVLIASLSSDNYTENNTFNITCRSHTGKTHTHTQVDMARQNKVYLT